MFGKKCSLIGVVHLLPLPGAAGCGGSFERIIEESITDARIYKEEGFDALIIENTHDAPYLRGRVEPETTAAMAVIANCLKRDTKLPLGVQILAGANLEALAVANAACLDFIRVEGFVYAHVGDEGIHQACAGELVRRRFNICAEKVKIFADIKKKHSSHAITHDISLAETARDAEYFKADGVIVTGVRTGDAPHIEDVRSVRNAVNISVLLGSGVTPENLPEYASIADALIIGSSAKFDGQWSNRVDRERCKRLLAASLNAGSPIAS